MSLSVLVFPAIVSDGPRQLPLIQQGPIWVAAENVDRQQFERVVANLVAMRPQDFGARARGQNIGTLTYLWPKTLPSGYTIEPKSIQAAWDDFLLQGGHPYIELTANGPDGETVVIKGGREASGTTFLVPEGGGVERSTPRVRGSQASAARTPEGAILVWTEADSLFAITASSLSIEQLVTIAEGLEAVDAAEFFRRAQR